MSAGLRCNCCGSSGERPVAAWRRPFGPSGTSRYLAQALAGASLESCPLPREPAATGPCRSILLRAWPSNQTPGLARRDMPRCRGRGSPVDDRAPSPDSGHMTTRGRGRRPRHGFPAHDPFLPSADSERSASRPRSRLRRRHQVYRIRLEGASRPTAVRVLIPTHFVHSFRRMSSTDSDSIRPPVPIHFVHPFRRISSTWKCRRNGGFERVGRRCWMT